MDFRIFTEPQQGASYEDLLTVALKAEELGFSAFFRSDHYLKMGDMTGLPGPSDAWVTLAGLARETTSIRLGTLVSSATFRLPGPMAIKVATVDAMSNGRVELGIGTGWYDEEHTSYGIPFPGFGERFDRLTEQLEVITGLWGAPEGETFTHHGKHYEVLDSPALPKPVQTPRPPIIIGGFGPKRTPQLAARFADEFNVPFADAATTAELGLNVDKACEAIGRDPATVIRSAAQVLCIAEDPETLQRRADAIGREVDELRTHGLAGSPSEVTEKVQGFADRGIERLYLQVLDLSDLEHLVEAATLMDD